MSHLKRKSVLAGAALVAAAWATPAHAAPFITLSLQGRVTGSGDPFSSTVVVSSSSQSIDYQLVADMAPTGTTNAQSTGRTITSLTAGTDGANSLKVDAFELATDTSQVSFTAAGALQNGWGAGTGAIGGTPTARAGGTGNDLLAIRPVQAAGVFTSIDPTVVMTGTFNTTTLGNADSLVRVRWSTAAGNTGSLKINGSTTVFLSGTSEAAADPFVGYTPLTLTVPEPASLSMLGMAAVGLLARRRKA